MADIVHIKPVADIVHIKPVTDIVHIKPVADILHIKPVADIVHIKDVWHHNCHGPCRQHPVLVFLEGFGDMAFLTLVV